MFELPPAGSRKLNQSTFPIRMLARFCNSALKACARIFLWPCMPFAYPPLAGLTGSEPQPTSVDPKRLRSLPVGGHRLADVVEVVEHPRNGGRVGIRGHDVECGPGAGLVVDVTEEGPCGGSIRRVAQKAREHHLRLRVRLLDHRVREGQQLRVGGGGRGGHRTLQIGFVPDLPGVDRQRCLAGMLCSVGAAPVVPAAGRSA